MGKLAGPQAHGLRYKLHTYVDPLWKKGYLSRTETYAWLAELTDCPTGQFHIANLDTDEAQQLLNKLKEQKDYNLEFIKTYGGTYSI